MFFYQPSLIGLHLILLSFAEFQYDKTGDITINMALFQAFWWLYLFTHYVKEEFMLSTWDVIAENFGFMLVWGDVVFVPFWYSVGGWYVVEKSSSFEIWEAILLVLFHVASHYLFRMSNWQKYEYKQKGMHARIWGKEPRLLGGRVLASGFWGIGRHLNYTGEILTYLSIAMCCGGKESIVPYLIPITLLAILTHRAYRDEKKCEEKYRYLWTEYCEIARFRIIPGVY